jgi:5-methylcytosine-specific restriction protein A
MEQRQRHDVRKPEWNGLYSHRRWRKRRARQLDREPLCRMCKAEDRVTIATIADHIEPHRGDLTKFWTGELQSLCKPHHDATKQSIEKGGDGRQPRQAIGVDGWPA